MADQIEMATTREENIVIAARLNTFEQTPYSTEAKIFEVSNNRHYRCPQSDR